MNKIYRVVWNAETGQWVVASEMAKGRKKKASGGTLAAVALMPALTAVGSMAYMPQAFAGSDIFECATGNPLGTGFDGRAGTTAINSYNCPSNGASQFNYIGGGTFDNQVNWVYNNGDPTYLVVNSSKTATGPDGTAPQSITMLAKGGVFVKGQMNMTGNKITGLANGTAATDAATFGQLNDAMRYFKAGGLRDGTDDASQEANSVATRATRATVLLPLIGVPRLGPAFAGMRVKSGRRRMAHIEGHAVP